jgi:hypothetical protein
MNKKLFCVSDGQTEMVSMKTLEDRLSRPEAAGAVTFLVDDPATQAIMIRMSEVLGRMVPEKLRERQEQRIETLLSAMMDFDPLDAAETRLDLRNAEKRQEFLRSFPVIEAQTIHKLAGHAGTNASQTAASWRAARKILGLPFGGKIVYPRFQFDADGQPFALMRDVLKALPDEMTPWQIAFWIVSPNAQLDLAAPIDAIRKGDGMAIAAAERERLEVIG